jgi:hypothetical protein
MDDRERFLTSYFAALGATRLARAQLERDPGSLTAGGINQRNLPFQIRISVTARMSSRRVKMVTRLEALVQEAEQEGHGVRLELLL